MKPNQRLSQMSLANSMVTFIDLLEADLVEVDEGGVATYRLRSGVNLAELRTAWTEQLARLEAEEEAYLDAKYGK